MAFLLSLDKSKTKTSIWYAGFIFSIGLGSLAEFFDPVPSTSIAHHIQFFELLARFCSALSYRFSPYFLLLAGISVIPFKQTRKTKFYWLLLTPIVLSFIYDLFFWNKGFILVYLDYSLNFWVLAIWAIAYGLAGNFLLLYAFIAEKNPKEKIRKIILFIVTLPSLYPIYKAYVSPLLLIGRHDFISHITALFIFLVFTMAAVLAYKYGFLGIKLSIEKESKENSLKLITSSTTILTHSLKNEISKIDYAAETLKRMTNSGTTFEVIKIILDSTAHLQKMIERIQIQIRDITLIKENCNITELVDSVLDSLKLLIEENRIQLKKEYETNLTLYCDKIHLKEALLNIVSNSIEAINYDGLIQVMVFTDKKWVKIIIKDNGVGIAKENLSHVFEPFFSTKKIHTNYGLGLSYCYNVIYKHNGILKIDSEEHIGTTVTISLPLNAPKRNQIK